MYPDAKGFVYHLDGVALTHCRPPKVNRWSNPVMTIAEIQERPPSSSSSDEEFSDARDNLPSEAPRQPALPAVSVPAPVSVSVPEPAPEREPVQPSPASDAAPAPARRRSGLSEVAVPARRLPTVLTSKRKLPDPKVHVFEAMLREEQVSCLRMSIITLIVVIRLMWLVSSLW